MLHAAARWDWASSASREVESGVAGTLLAHGDVAASLSCTACCRGVLVAAGGKLAVAPDSVPAAARMVADGFADVYLAETVYRSLSAYLSVSYYF